MAGALTISTLNNDTGPLATQNGMTGIAKAWVNFNGTGTPAIRGSFNVSSITDNGTGDYTVNFTTAMPNANFSAVFGGARDNPPTNGVGGCALYAGTTTTQRLITSNSNFSAVDFETVMVAIFSS
jgi:hypothetical protein